MNPRIEKKVSKRLCEIAPGLFHTVWQDHQCPTEYADEQQSRITGCHMISVDEPCSVLHWYMRTWMFAERFTKNWNGDNWPDTGTFKPTAKNLIALAKEHDLAQQH